MRRQRRPTRCRSVASRRARRASRRAARARAARSAGARSARPPPRPRSPSCAGVTVTLGWRPERARRRQRLGLEDVERGGLERAVVEAGEDVRLDLQGAAAGIHQDRAAEHAVPGEPARRGRGSSMPARLPASPAAGRRGDRCGRGRRRARGPSNVAMPSTGLPLRLQPATSKPMTPSFLAASRPSTPMPMMPTRSSRAAGAGRTSRHSRSRWNAS